MCSFYSPQRQSSKTSSRLQPVLEAECYSGAGILDLDLEFVTKEYEILEGGFKESDCVSNIKKARRQMRKERAKQIARTRTDTTTSTDSDATLKHNSGCHACRSRKRASQAAKASKGEGTRDAYGTSADFLL